MREPYNRPFDTCLHPIKLNRGCSDLFDYVPCGSCISCNKRKSSTWQSRLFHHLTCGKYSCLFITLTYSNEHLPLVTLSNLNDNGTSGSSSDHPLIVHSSSTRTRFGHGVSSGSFTRVPLYSLFSSDDLDTYLYENRKFIADNFPHYVLSNVAGNKIYDTSYTFAVSLKKDVQDFIRRLRTNISRESSLVSEDPRFTYFICSEYGPTTFRPHYHGILFFNSQRVAEWSNNSGVFDAWGKQSLPIDSFGNKISSPVSNCEATAEYVSKYVTCPVDLPPLLYYPPFKPFHLQSISVPIGSQAFDVDDVPDMLSKGDILYHTKYIDKNTHEQVTIDRPFPSSSWRRVFPKFLCHRLLSVSTISKLISRILQFKSIDDFPDYRDYLTEYYHLNCIEVVHTELASVLKHELFIGSRTGYPDNPYSGLYALHRIAPRSFDYLLLPVGDSSSTRVHIVTPSEVSCHLLRDLGGSCDALDLFLFGIPENRCVAKIIHRFVNSTSWSKHSHQFYIDLYHQFFARQFSDLMKLQYDYFNHHAETLGYDNPDLYDHIYYASNDSAYFSTLYSNYEIHLRRQISAQIKKTETFDQLNDQL